MPETTCARQNCFSAERAVWFDQEATKWDEALPIGNGFMGAMVFGGVATERLQVNEDSVWSGGPMERVGSEAREHLEEIRNELFAGHVRNAEQILERHFYASPTSMRHYQTLGDIWLRFADMKCVQDLVKDDYENPVLVERPAATDGYERSLDVTRALGTICYGTDHGAYRRSFFASYPAHVIVYRIEAQGPGTVDFELTLTRKDNHSCKCLMYCDGTEALGDDTVRLFGRNGAEDGLAFELVARIVTEGGRVCHAGSRLVVEAAQAATVLVTARTTYRDANPLEWCLHTLDKAAAKPYHALLEEHVADYRSLYDTFELTFSSGVRPQLPTPRYLEYARANGVDAAFFATYFAYCRYLFISSAREGSLPPNLQGVWNEDFEPAWGSRYTVNINIQMIHWIVEQTGLSSLHMPLLEHLERMVPKGREVAQAMYGARGFCCHHNTDLWGDCAPQDAHPFSTIWPMGGAWLCLHAIEHWEYTRDRAFAERFFPVVGEAVRFFVDYTVEDTEGRRVTGPSCAPENIYITDAGDFGSLCMAPTMDTEILRDLIDGYLSMAEELGVADAEVDEARALREALPPLSIGSDGRLMEWQHEYGELDPGHRHVSHLFALFPSRQIRRDKTPELCAAAAKTLDQRLANGATYCGWSKAWCGSLYARMGEAARAWESVSDLIKESTLDNLFDTCPPFEFDGNIGTARALLEMCVQDYGDEIFLLPALPQELGTGAIRGYRLLSGGSLDMTWENGVVTKAVWHVERPANVVFHIDDEHACKVDACQTGEEVAIV